MVKKTKVMNMNNGCLDRNAYKNDPCEPAGMFHPLEGSASGMPSLTRTRVASGWEKRKERRGSTL